MKFFMPAETIEKITLATSRILPPGVDCLFIFRETDGNYSLICADVDMDCGELASILRNAADEIEGRGPDHYLPN